jgi:alkyl hydroperoxide reductase subunit AhpC
VAGRAVRGTFVIDKEGTVRWKVVNEIPDARDHDEYAKVLADLS